MIQNYAAISGYWKLKIFLSFESPSKQGYNLSLSPPSARYYLKNIQRQFCKNSMNKYRLKHEEEPPWLIV